MPDIWLDVDAALTEVPVNILPLLDDTDFKTREVAVAYNAAGMDLVWNFITTGGVFTQTAVTPTTAGDYDWTHQGDGMYTIEIPASAGASINNDTEGFGWFTGVATGVLPWRGPVIGFRAAGLNNKLIDDAYSTERGLAGTALPAAAAEAAGGLYTRGTGAGQINQAANGQIDANVIAISGDSIAADNLETMLDGTGGQTLSLGRIIVSSTTLNEPAVKFTGNGTGAGLHLLSGSGATGNALHIESVATNGNAIYALGIGTGDGLHSEGGSADGNGFHVVGKGTGHGAIIAATGTGNGLSVTTVDGDGIVVDANGIGQAGMQIVSANGHGLSLNGGVNSGDRGLNIDRMKIDGTTEFMTSVSLGSTLSVAGATTFTGAVTASNASNNINLGTDAINSTVIAATAVTEIQAGLSTLDAVGVRTAVGLASANLDTQLTAIDDLIDTEVAAIKAKTDQLTFTNANKVDSAILAINDLATVVAQKIAHIVLRRTMANVEAAVDGGDTLDVSSIYGFIQQAQESNTVDNAGKLTVYKTDGTTELAQRTITTDAAADPTTGIS